MAVAEVARISDPRPAPQGRSAQSTAALDRARRLAQGDLRPGFDILAPEYLRPAPEPIKLSTLLRDGVLAVHDLPAAARATIGLPDQRIERLLARKIVAEEPLYRLLARETGFGLADLSEPADVRLIDQLGALTCLTEGLLPWRQIGATTLIVAATPQAFHRNRARLTATFGKVIPAIAPASAIESRIRAVRGHDLARRAETRVAEALSCRSFPRLFSGAEAKVLLALTGLAILTMQSLLAAFTILAIVSLVASMALKIAALFASLRGPKTVPDLGPAPQTEPVVSIIVALYREAAIAPRLIRRLSRLTYPKDLLDIVLVVEEDDLLTRQALTRAVLPPWMRVVVAPEGRVKTKPRALNFALDFCRGSIVGVYDAEDAPEPDQIARVVQGFAIADPRVVCLQGALDFYNPGTNWLARCFTLEYASWFRAMLPGLERLGLPIPLGGTTLFFRRAALERLGGWDAFNVTEDADLGLRLARDGYFTAILPTTTYEEANCRALPWVKQRSRWVKGYMMTYLTHMRRPALLWRDLGPKAFLGFQVLFLGSILQGLLAPVLWTWWLLSLGLPHPLGSMLNPAVVHLGVALFLGAEAANLGLGVLGLRRSGHKINPLWLLTLPAYFPLQSFAAWKALWEVLHLPFYWDKTSHGLFDLAA
jgi:cellulose synthase/poly-beta-1,6-N-acetylglucosamine synthase-like glycosyltransferase